MSKHNEVKLYDTTLRDGTQGEGVNFSSLDKIRIAKELDAFGMHYIEGGWPGSNPKDVAFFERAADIEWKHARIAAFGSTRRKDIAVEDDSQVRTLLEAKTPVITFFGKSWRLHVTEILGTTEQENQAMIRDPLPQGKRARGRLRRGAFLRRLQRRPRARPRHPRGGEGRRRRLACPLRHQRRHPAP